MPIRMNSFKLSFVFVFLFLVSAVSGQLTVQNFTGRAIYDVNYVTGSSLRNITFFQKPYISLALFDFNITDASVNDTYSDASSNVCSGSTANSCANADDDSYSSFAFDSTAADGAVTILQNYTNPGNLTSPKLKYSYAVGEDNFKSYCWDHGSNSWDLIEMVASSPPCTQYYKVINVPSDCKAANEDIYLKFEIEYTNNCARLYDAEIYQEYEYNLTAESEKIFFSKINPDNYIQNNTKDLLNSNAAGNTLDFLFFSSLYYNVTTNFTIEYYYNRTLNITILNPFTNESLNPTCSYNSETVMPYSELIYFNSSLANLLDCSLTGYGNLSQQIVPDNASYIYFMPQNILNITFYDEITKNLIDDRNITFELFGSSYTFNTTTESGKINVSFFEPDDYTFRFFAPGYQLRYWNYELEDSSSNTLDLYMLQDGYNVTFSVYDTFSNPVESATVLIYRYDLEENAYILVNQKNTDFQGMAVLDVELNGEFYQIVITYNGDIKRQTNGAILSETSYQFIISISDPVFQTYYKASDMTYSDITFNTDSDTFRFYFLDSLDVASQVCLKVYTVAFAGETLYDSSCSSASSANLLVSVVNSSNAAYHAKAIATISGEEEILETMVWSFQDASTFGNFGVLIVVVLTIVAVFLGKYSMEAAMIIAPLPTLAGAYFSFIPVPFGAAIGLEVGFIVLAGLLSFWKRGL